MMINWEKSFLHARPTGSIGQNRRYNRTNLKLVGVVRGLPLRAPSDDNGHRLNHPRRRDSVARDLLWHHHDPKRLNSSPMCAKISSIFGGHLPHRLLALEILEHNVGPSSPQDILQFPLIDAIVRNHNQSPTATLSQTGEAHIAPRSPPLCSTVSDISQPAPQPPYAIRYGH